MKTAFLGIVALLADSALAAITIISPRPGETVPLHTAKCIELLAMTNVQERAKFILDNPVAEVLRPVPVRVEWSGDGEVDVTVTEEGAPMPFVSEHVSSNRLEVWNLKVATRYELRVAQGALVTTREFMTEDRAPRFIMIPPHEENSVKYRGVPNMRDIGGRIVADGRRIRQGLVFRSSGLNNNANEKIYTHDEILALYRNGELAKRTEPNAKKYLKEIEDGTFGDGTPMRLVKSPPTEPGTPRLNDFWRRYIVEKLGVRTDVDLRKESEVFGMVGSPLGDEVRLFRQWQNYEAYRLVHTKGLAATKAIFRLFMDRKSYPIDFHCIGGADRTGTVAALLLGVLGASDNQIWEDYQLTGRPVNDARHLGWFRGFVDSMNAYPGETLSSRICEYFRRRCGFSEGDLGCIRSILLEPRIEYVGHAGEEFYGPGHSPLAYRSAVEHGVDYLKMDIRETSDGEVVLSHDDNLKKFLGCEWKIGKHTLKDIQKSCRFLPAKGKHHGPNYNDSTNDTIQTLADGLKWGAKTRKGIWLDFKDGNPALYEKVLKMVADAGITTDRVMVATWNTKALEYMKDRHPEIRRVAHTYVRPRERGYETNHAKGRTFETPDQCLEAILKECERLGLYGLNMPVNIVRKGRVIYDTPDGMTAKLRAKGLWVARWFVFDEKAAVKARAQGSDAFVTNCKEHCLAE